MLKANVVDSSEIIVGAIILQSPYECVGAIAAVACPETPHCVITACPRMVAHPAARRRTPARSAPRPHAVGEGLVLLYILCYTILCYTILYYNIMYDTTL